MATVRSRVDRGRETELLVAEVWRRDGWPYAEVKRGQGADLTGTPGVQVEVKARSEFRPLEWMRQAARHGDGALPVVVMRPNGAGPENVDHWPAILPHHVLRRLLHLAGYGDEPRGGTETSRAEVESDFIAGSWR